MCQFRVIKWIYWRPETTVIDPNLTHLGVLTSLEYFSGRLRFKVLCRDSNVSGRLPIALYAPAFRKSAGGRAAMCEISMAPRYSQGLLSSVRRGLCIPIMFRGWCTPYQIGSPWRHFWLEGFSPSATRSTTFCLSSAVNLHRFLFLFNCFIRHLYSSRSL